MAENFVISALLVRCSDLLSENLEKTRHNLKIYVREVYLDV